MKHFQKKVFFHKIMKEHILQNPSPQFEATVMLQIKRHKVEKEIKTNYLSSLVLAIIGSLIGLSSTIWMAEIKTVITEAFGLYSFYFSQATLVLIVLILVDFVISSFLNYKNRTFSKVW